MWNAYARPLARKRKVRMAHFIADTCIGCSICEIKCPTDAITGRRDQLYVIDPGLCIDCDVCGRFCPVECILDENGKVIPRIRPKEMPKAIVIEELCNGCNYCVEICPFDCISLENAEGWEDIQVVAKVHEKECVGCQLCEAFCDKEAIIVPLPEGKTKLEFVLGHYT